MPVEANSVNAVSYEPGQTVIYPHHGACVVDGIVSREVGGETTDYLVLRATAGDLKVSVPVDRADQLGLRPPVSGDELEGLVELLQKTDVRMPSNWSRRLKNHQEKLKSGDVYQVAEVVRNLALRRRSTELSVAEREMFAHARTNLVNELAPSLEMSIEDAGEYLDAVLRGEDVERTAA